MLFLSQMAYFCVLFLCDINPYNAEIFLYKPWEPKRFSSLNTYVMDLQPLEMLWFFQWGIIFVRHNLTSTDVRL